MATFCPQKKASLPSMHCGKHKRCLLLFQQTQQPHFSTLPQMYDSRLKSSSIDLAYFFQDLRSDALKAISWPSRCGAIVIPASADQETVNCAETQGDLDNRWEFGVLFTWWHHSVIIGGMIGANRPHEAKQTAPKHGCKKHIKSSVEQQDEA